MTEYIRDIQQRFWSSEQLPHLVIRTTRDSVKSYKAHCHAELSIGIIAAGQTCLSVKTMDITLNREDVVLIQPDLVHACNPVQGKPRSYHMLYLDHQWCCDVLSLRYQQQVTHFRCDHGVVLAHPEYSGLAGLIGELMASDMQRDHYYRVDDVLRSMVLAYCSPAPEDESDDGAAYRTRELLLGQLENPPSVEDIARQSGRTPESVIRSFKRCFGITPKAYVSNSRVEKAKLLLRAGMKIADVAVEVGYSDQSQLHKAFVSYTASTPRQYQSSGIRSDSRVNFRQ
jgi:AraC-like DNA-binding protein